MTRHEAISKFAKLILQYGLRWGPNVPASAYADMTEVSRVLSIDEKLDILNQCRR